MICRPPRPWTRKGAYPTCRPPYMKMNIALTVKIRYSRERQWVIPYYRRLLRRRYTLPQETGWTRTIFKKRIGTLRRNYVSGKPIITNYRLRGNH